MKLNEYNPMNIVTSFEKGNEISQILKSKYIKMVIIILILILVYVSLLPVFESTDIKLPTNLRELIRETSNNALVKKKIETIAISKPKYITDNQMEFCISYTLKESTKPIIINKNIDDPFQESLLDKSLVVSKIGKFHTIVLNKFNTIKDHSLLITNNFIEQSLPLSKIDLDVWYWCIIETNSLGFFNSNYIAGASVSHKHMQLVPLDELWIYRQEDSIYPIPIDDIIIPNIENNIWLPYSMNKRNLYSVQSFKFIHKIAVLDSNNITYLEKIYTILVNSIKTNSYNLILTKSYFMIVPRSKREFSNELGVNGFGFVGLLLGRNPDIIDTINNFGGPLKVLGDVGYEEMKKVEKKKEEMDNNE
jgi:ATP adenylyltransferase